MIKVLGRMVELVDLREASRHGAKLVWEPGTVPYEAVLVGRVAQVGPHVRHVQPGQLTAVSRYNIQAATGDAAGIVHEDCCLGTVEEA